MMSPSQKDLQQPLHFYVDEDSPVHVHVESKPSAKAVAVTTKVRPSLQPANYKPKYKDKKNSSKIAASTMDSLLLESVLTEMKRFNASAKQGPTDSSQAAVVRYSNGPNMVVTGENQLLARLVDFEQESVALARTVDQVGELTRRAGELGQRQSRNFTNKDLVVLRNTCTSLREQLEAFDVNNRVLRSLLRQREEEERDKSHLQQQNDSLIVRHAELETMNKRFQTEILDKEKHLRDLQVFVDAQRDENLAIQSSHDVSESTRVHLQKQLRVKESDCNRMAVQIRQLETQMAQDRIDSEQLLQLMQDTRDKAEKDKVALKRAARAQKERANRLAEEVDRLHLLLVDKEPLLEQLVKEEEDRIREENDDSGEKSVDKSVCTSEDHPPLKDVSDEERKSYETLISHHQQACQRVEQRNHTYELRLRNAEERNKSMANQLSETSNLVDSCRKDLKEMEASRQTMECKWREAEARLEEVRREKEALQLKMESALADLKKQREAFGESVRERRLRQRVKSLEDEQRNLKDRLERTELEKTGLEKFYTSRMIDLKSQLDLNLSKDKSLRLYVQHIKDSYNKCFGDVNDDS